MAKEEQKTAWVLLRSHNEYDQHGQYFVAVWYTKPTLKELAEFFKGNLEGAYFSDAMAALAFLMHIEAGGGRQDSEDVWFDLQQVKFGKKYGY